jgi:hypothetical protein
MFFGVVFGPSWVSFLFPRQYLGDLLSGYGFCPGGTWPNGIMALSPAL